MENSSTNTPPFPQDEIDRWIQKIVGDRESAIAEKLARFPEYLDEIYNLIAERANGKPDIGLALHTYTIAKLYSALETALGASHATAITRVYIDEIRDQDRAIFQQIFEETSLLAKKEGGYALTVEEQRQNTIPDDDRSR